MDSPASVFGWNNTSTPRIRLAPTVMLFHRHVFVPLDSTTWRTTLCGCKRRIPCSSGTRWKLGWNTTSAHWKRFGTDSEDLTVSELVGPRRTILPRTGASCDDLTVRELATHTLEQHFRADEAFDAGGDDLAVWELKGFRS